ncbi:MAG TPA: Rv0909 family putative TA system antitoxin [Amnibacterium sp.]|jgi:hypothetical protein|uniref:Rv0909 family putative TA system antitoxin n=1 Tax=Amnibacterium sp. TaxID=1872496 RepID=UPI002F949EB5
MADFGDMAKNALNSDKGEEFSDEALRRGGDEADKATGGSHTKQIDEAEQAADGKIGQ